MCLILLIVECVIRCMGDILEYFNDWSYVQCAIRGTSYLDSVRITYSMMKCANMKYIICDLLLNSLVSSGTLMIALVALSSGAGTGYLTDGANGAMWGGLLGFLVGLTAGAAATGTINSGVKTILVCWADDPAPLQASHQDIHDEFEKRLSANQEVERSETTQMTARKQEQQPLTESGAQEPQ